MVVKYFGEGVSIINISLVVISIMLLVSVVYSGMKGVVDVIIGVFVFEFGLCKICVNVINLGMIVIEGMYSVGIIGFDLEV